MEPGTSSAGRSASDVIEGEAGGLLHRAIILEDLLSAAYTAMSEFEYDDEAEAKALVEAATEMQTMLSRLSLAEDARLTLLRECRCCGGSRDVAGCPECGGVGYVHADEADG